MPRWFFSGPDRGAPASICVLHSRSALQLPQEALWARSSWTDFRVTVCDPSLSHDPRPSVGSARCPHSCLCELLPPFSPFFLLLSLMLTSWVDPITSWFLSCIFSLLIFYLFVFCLVFLDDFLDSTFRPC